MLLSSFLIAVGFSVANLVYVGLEISHFYEIRSYPECEEVWPITYPPFFHMTFILIQTFFIFKNRMVCVS